MVRMESILEGIRGLTRCWMNRGSRVLGKVSEDSQTVIRAKFRGLKG